VIIVVFGACGSGDDALRRLHDGGERAVPLRHREADPTDAGDTRAANDKFGIREMSAHMPEKNFACASSRVGLRFPRTRSLGRAKVMAETADEET
jgi:hypothetical protein